MMQNSAFSDGTTPHTGGPPSALDAEHPPALRVRDLVKSYGDLRAVDGISFDVPEGSFFAFLGPNGAGKSTTLSIVCSTLDRDSGEVSIFGRDVRDTEVRRDIGVVFQDSMMDRLLTVRENLVLRGGMYGLSGDMLADSVSEAMGLAGCSEFADRRYGGLSGGQRRRADIARALVHRPRILLLDEPTSGLDPQTRSRIRDTVRSLSDDAGMTVILTTHYMEEAADADDIVVINHGRIAAHGTPERLKEDYCADMLLIVPRDRDGAVGALESAGLRYTEDCGVLEVPLSSTLDAVPILRVLEGMMSSFEVRTGTLDDAFIRITGEEIE